MRCWYHFYSRCCSISVRQQDRSSKPLPTTLTITQPDDWHVHLRDGDALDATVRDISRYFGRAIIMPNLLPPVRNLVEATAYKERILSALKRSRPEAGFSPLMVLYLTDNTSAEDIKLAAADNAVFAAKLYPAGATTNSDNGVTDVQALAPVLEAMQDCDLPLLIHGEVTAAEVDVFDREKCFIDSVLSPILSDYPELRIVLEHISTRDAAEFVAEGPDKLAATITAHHLLHNRNDMLVGGIKPHYYCLPILKRADHQQALLRAATSGSAKFFLGTDSAPHPIGDKETSCGCAGCYTAHAAIELYAEAFEQCDALDKLEGFASFYGPDFYRLPRNTEQITLVKNPWQAPEELQFGSQTVRPLHHGQTIQWQVTSKDVQP